jgi:hypothetical protein
MKSFELLLVRFINVNQQFYDNQKIIIRKQSDLVHVMNTINNEDREALKNNKLNIGEQIQLAKDALAKTITLNKKIEIIEQYGKKIDAVSSELQQLTKRIDAMKK